MFTIDYWLLRRVFQPIVDWLSPWCGHYQLARWSAYVALISLIPMPLDYIGRVEWMLAGGITVANALLILIWYQRISFWRLCQRAEELGHVVRPTFAEAAIRIGSLMAYSFVIPVYFLPPIRVGSSAEALAFVAYVSALYFAGCNQGTPRRRRVMQWAHA